MALPTLRPYYLSKRAPVGPEKLIVQRRTHEEDVRRKWGEHLRYFNSADVLSSKQEAWTSSKSFQDSMDAYHSRGRDDERKQQLAERRDKLRTLLEEEKKILERELMELSGGKLSHMKNRADNLKKHREEERKKLAQEKLVEHWHLNCPDLRQLESRQMERATHQAWEEQISRKEQEADNAKREKERIERAEELERQVALKDEEERKRRRKLEEKEQASALQQQMLEVRRREEEAAFLEKQQMRLLQEQSELERVREERKQAEENQRKIEYGQILRRQYKAQLRRRSQQVQEALELDLKILENLSLKEKEQQTLQTARRERALADAEWMKKVVSEQLRLEKEREAELDVLYQEEAARMWQHREEEWEREKRAREKLMAQVLAERQQQIQARLDTLKARQTESIRQREELLHEMEVASQLTSRDGREKKLAQERRAKELEVQITERRQKAEEARCQYERELQEQRRVEEEYEAMVRAEEKRMMATGFPTKVHKAHTRRHAWC